MTLSVFLLLLLNILMLAGGQTLWKLGLSRHSFTFSVTGIIKMLFSPIIFTGLVIYALASVVWFYIISKVDLSTAYPMQSLCYIFVSVAGLVLFKENISLIKWGGLIMITAGAFLVSRG
jgi:drug/metabolite transporter (DMT)-like permease